MTNNINDFLAELNVPLVYSDEIIGNNTKKIYLTPTKAFKLNQIFNLDRELGMFYGVGNDLSISLEGSKIVLELPLQNNNKTIPTFKNLRKNGIRFNKAYFQNNRNLKVFLGESYGKPVSIEIAKMPHMIIAGTTGSRQVCITS